MDLRRNRERTILGGSGGRRRYRGSRAILTALLIGLFSVAVLSAAHQPTAVASHLHAEFDWRMADRFGLDENNDGMVDYFPETSDAPGLDGDIRPGTFRVTLDGCDSTNGSSITYRWSIRGQAAIPASTNCTLVRQLPEGTYLVTLEVRDGAETVVTQKDVVVQDWLIVALGDSYGSGEGNPDIPVEVSAIDDLDAAQQDLNAALGDLADAELDYQETTDALDDAFDVCDDNNDGKIDGFDALGFPGCVVALADVVTTAISESLDAILEAFDDAYAAAEEALNVFETAVDEAEDFVLGRQEELKGTWQLAQCHRSANAGSAQAALMIEEADPRSSVTFVHLACSGAEANIGFLNPYQGVDVELPEPLDCDEDDGCLAPQVQEAARLVGDREVDALYMSIGGNDANFAPLIVACIIQAACHQSALPDPVIVGGEIAACTVILGPISIGLVPVCAAFLIGATVLASEKSAAELIEEGIEELGDAEDPGLYHEVALEFDARLPDLPDNRMFISEYPNVTENDDGAFCPDFNPLNNLPGLSLEETEFARDTVTEALNGAVAGNAAAESWNLVGGIFDAYARHGYCADNHFVVRADESFVGQGNHTGMVHPNSLGQAVYRDRIFAALLPSLYTGGDLDEPRRPAEPPVAEAGGPYSTSEGSPVQLDGSGSYSPDGDLFTYGWTSLTGTLNGETTATPTFTPLDNGTQQVVLNVFDDDGVGVDVATVFVQNVPPTVVAGNDRTTSEGSNFAVSASYSDPGFLDTHTATVSWGDGSPAEPASPFAGQVGASHVFADNGVFTVTVCVTDDDGGSDCDSLLVSVANVAPTLNAGAGRTSNEGALESISTPFHDAGTRDTHTATVDWGDGTGVNPATVTESPFGPPGSIAGLNGSITGSHVYADNGSYTVSVCVTDDDSTSACGSFQIVAANAPPVVNAGIGATINEGSLFTLAPAQFTDPGTRDTHTALINWGDGSPIQAGAVAETPSGPPGSISGASGTVSGSHAYGDNGAYTVTVCVSDDDGGTNCGTLVVNVLNVRPTVSLTVASGAPFALVLVPIQATGPFSDPGFLDTHTASLNWGDGSPAVVINPAVTPIQRSHPYSAPGFFTVTLTVTDDDGGVGTVSAVIEIVDPLDALDRTVDGLVALAALPSTNGQARARINGALDDLRGNNGGASANGAFSLLEDDDWGAAVEKIQAALEKLRLARAADTDLDLGFAELTLAWTAKSVALDVIAQAQAVATSSGAQKSVASAVALIGQGDAALSLGSYAAAADLYQDAIGKVAKLL